MSKFTTLGRDLKIVFRAIRVNVAVFAGLQLAGMVFLRLCGAYPQASWLDLLVDSFHMSLLERVVEPGDGIVPGVLTFVLPLLTVVVVGEGALRVLGVFLTRDQNREEWDRMVAKSFNNHIVICGVGELGRALVHELLATDPAARIVLVDPHPGVLAELGVNNPNVCHLESDMTNLLTLKQANCQHASLIILASGNDTYNLETAFKAIGINPQAEIWVRLYRSHLVDLLEIEKKPNVHFFCPYQAAAQALVKNINNK